MSTAPAPRGSTARLRSAIERTRKDWSGPIPSRFEAGRMKRDPRWRALVVAALTGTASFVESWTADDVIGIERFGGSVWKYWMACAYYATGNTDLMSYFASGSPAKLYTPRRLLSVTSTGVVPPEEQGPAVEAPSAVPHLRLVRGGAA